MSAFDSMLYSMLWRYTVWGRKQKLYNNSVYIFSVTDLKVARDWPDFPSSGLGNASKLYSQLFIVCYFVFYRLTNECKTTKTNDSTPYVGLTAVCRHRRRTVEPVDVLRICDSWASLFLLRRLPSDKSPKHKKQLYQVTHSCSFFSGTGRLHAKNVCIFLLYLTYLSVNKVGVFFMPVNVLFYD